MVSRFSKIQWHNDCATHFEYVFLIGEMSPRDVIKQFSGKLKHQLPLENDIFFAAAKQAGLFPMNTGDSIGAKSTRDGKVTYFLQHVVEPRAEEYLPKLLKVMRDSKVADVVRLADDIQAATGLGTYVWHLTQVYIYPRVHSKNHFIYWVIQKLCFKLKMDKSTLHKGTNIM